MERSARDKVPCDHDWSHTLVWCPAEANASASVDEDDETKEVSLGSVRADLEQQSAQLTKLGETVSARMEKLEERMERLESLLTRLLDATSAR